LDADHVIPTSREALHWTCDPGVLLERFGRCITLAFLAWPAPHLQVLKPRFELRFGLSRCTPILPADLRTEGHPGSEGLWL
jgi:hypothetical protein